MTRNAGAEPSRTHSRNHTSVCLYVLHQRPPVILLCECLSPAFMHMRCAITALRIVGPLLALGVGLQ